MRVGMFYPRGSMRLPVDVQTIWTNPRGLTGSEIAFFMYALELAKLGFGVTIFTKVNSIGDLVHPSYPGVRITTLGDEEWDSTYCTQTWDALISWMTPNPLKRATGSPLKIFNQQVSDFGQCEPGWESWVDVVAPLSHSHARHLSTLCSFPREGWRVMYNGVDTDEFKPGLKVPGKMIWASSHDRGLHWLLEAFPGIKARLPHAELHVFYDFDGVEKFSGVSDREQNSLFRELGMRSRYTAEALRRLSGKGVHSRGSVSREVIRQEMASSEILAYPCDPVRYTETFGVTVLEAMASGTVPVICTADSFSELWDWAPHVPPPYSDHKGEYADLLVSILADKPIRDLRADYGVTHAKQFEWSALAAKLSMTIMTGGHGGSIGLPMVDWT